MTYNIMFTSEDVSLLLDAIHKYLLTVDLKIRLTIDNIYDFSDDFMDNEFFISQLEDLFALNSKLVCLESLIYHFIQNDGQSDPVLCDKVASYVYYPF